MLGNTDWRLGRPAVIAHRGASQIAPENTLAAFRAAVELGADAIELDAKLTADGVIVVHHDSTLERTTSGQGPISSWTLSELGRLDAGGKFSDEFTGERIPTLREVLAAVGNDVLVNVELTNYAHAMDALPERAVSLVREMGMEKRVLFSSFNPIALRRIGRSATDIPVGLLLMRMEPAWMRGLLKSFTPHNAVHLQTDLATPEAVAREHARGRVVNVWTVNERQQMKELLEMGVDGLITDVPDLAREVLMGGNWYV